MRAKRYLDFYSYDYAINNRYFTNTRNALFRGQIQFPNVGTLRQCYIWDRKLEGVNKSAKRFLNSFHWNWEKDSSCPPLVIMNLDIAYYVLPGCVFYCIHTGLENVPERWNPLVISSLRDEVVEVRIHPMIGQRNNIEQSIHGKVFEYALSQDVDIEYTTNLYSGFKLSYHTQETSTDGLKLVGKKILYDALSYYHE